jgi:hypothetical protein
MEAASCGPSEGRLAVSGSLGSGGLKTCILPKLPSPSAGNVEKCDLRCVLIIFDVCHATYLIYAAACAPLSDLQALYPEVRPSLSREFVHRFSAASRD